MIQIPAPNSITRPYRGLSMQEVNIALTDESAILEYVLGREVYRRTEWLLLANGDDHALVAVRKESFEPLFSPVTQARVLAGPDRTAWIEDAETDVGNATSLAAAAARLGRDDIDAYAVQGRYEHVNVIWRPTPVRIVVTEVVPPEPAKLLDMARQVLEFDDELPRRPRARCRRHPGDGTRQPVHRLPAPLSRFGSGPARRGVLSGHSAGTPRGLDAHRV